MVQAYTALQVGVAHTAQVLFVLESHQDKRGITFKVYVLLPYRIRRRYLPPIHRGGR